MSLWSGSRSRWVQARASTTVFHVRCSMSVSVFMSMCRAPCSCPRQDGLTRSICDEFAHNEGGAWWAEYDYVVNHPAVAMPDTPSDDPAFQAAAERLAVRPTEFATRVPSDELPMTS